jgi:DNA repair exonuclease SbcCD ATPase subunit
MASIVQIVRKIIDDLSDGVSQLVLLVVVLQEKNSEVPPQLPQAASVVNQTAKTLANIAKQLAETNYKDHPSIKQEIIDAAVTVESATVTMDNAVRILQTSPNREAGWEGLVDACRIMAGKTIHLLQIVYGAELKRLFAEAQQVGEGLQDMNLKQAADDPQAFADKASEVGTKAVTFANHLKQRAQDEESPLLREQMEKDAEAIKKKANEFIDAVNRYLEDPTNPEKAHDVQRKMDELRKLINDASTRVRENQTDLPGDIQGVPSLQSLANERKQKQEEEKARQKLASIALSPSGEVVSPLQDQIQQQQALFDKIEDAAKKGDQEALAKAIQEANEQLEQLRDAARSLAENTEDPVRKQQIMNTLNEIDRVFPIQVTAAQQVVKDPNNVMKLTALRNATARLNDLLNNLNDETRKDDLADATREASKKADQIGAAVKENNPEQLRELIKDLDELRDRINKAAVAQAVADPAKAKEIAKCLQELDDLITQLKNDIKNNQSRVPQDVKAIKDKVAEIAAKTNADAIAAANRLADDVRKVSSAVAREDPVGVKVATKQMGPDGKAVLQLSKLAANMEKDPQKKASLTNALNDVDNGIKDSLLAIKDVLDRPKDENAKAKSLGENDKLLRSLEELKTALKGADPRAVSEDIGAPMNVDQLMKNVKDLEESLKELNNLNQKAKSGDQNAIKQMAPLANRIDNSTGQVSDIVANNRPEDEILSGLKDMKAALQNLGDKVAKRDGPGAANTSRVLVEAAKPLLEKVRKEAQNPNSHLSPDARAQLNQNASDIEKTLPPVIKTAKDAIQTGNMDGFNDASNRLKRAVSRTHDTLRPQQDEKGIKDTIADIESELVKLKDFARKGDVKNTQDTANRIATKGRNLHRMARKHIPPGDPDDPMAELKKLWNKILPAAAQKAAQNPNDQPAVKEFDNTLQQIRQNLNKVKQKTHADDVSPFQEMIEALDRIVDGAQRGNPNDVTKAANDTVQKLNVVVARINNEKDPSKKQEMSDIIQPLNDLVKEIISAAKDSVQDPGNKQKFERLQEAVEKAKDVLTRAAAVGAPTDPYRRATEAIQTAKADLAEVKGANRDGQPVSSVQQLIKQFENDANRAAAESRKVAVNESNPQRRKAIEDAVDRLQNAVNELSRTPGAERQKVEQNATKAGNALNELSEVLNSDPKEDLFNTKGRTKPYTAALKNPNNDLNAKDLLTAADELCKLLRSLIGQATDIARVQNPALLSPKAASALNMDALLQEIEKKPVQAPTVESIDKLLNQMKSLAEASEKITEPTKFEDVVDKVASDIRHKVEETELKLKVGTDVADELHKLAAAARSGKRQEMLVASRAVGVHINNIEQQLRLLADRIAGKNRVIQDKLIRLAVALRNYATQLKILTSVKAASIEENADNDATLTSITRLLGNVIKDSLESIDIAKITILKERK